MTKRVFTYLPVLAAGIVAAAMFASPASAVTFTSTTTIVDDVNGPNVDYTSTGLNADLTVGVPYTISSFIQAHINGTSFSSQTGTATATFNFTAPPGQVGSVIDSGTLQASVVQTDKHISIVWGDPLLVTFSSGALLSIDLANVDYNCGTNCNQDNFSIAGTFALVSAGSTALGETPIPAALPLLASGLGGFGLLTWRRKRKVTAA